MVGPIGSTKTRIIDLAGNVVDAAQIGTAYLSPKGAFWGIDQSQTLHHYDSAGASTSKATKLDGAAPQVVGDQIVERLDGSTVQVRAVLPKGDLAAAVKLGTVPDLLLPSPCLDASLRASVLYLPAFGSSPRVAHGFLQSDKGWSKDNVVKTDEPFNANFTTCGAGWAAAADAHPDHVQYVRCTAKECTYERIALSQSLSAARAAMLDDTLVLVDLVTVGSERGARIRVGPPKKIEALASQFIECADAEKETWISLVKGSKGVYVVLEDRPVGVLCAFSVSADGTVKPVEPASPRH